MRCAVFVFLPLAGLPLSLQGDSERRAKTFCAKRCLPSPASSTTSTSESSESYPGVSRRDVKKSRKQSMSSDSDNSDESTLVQMRPVCKRGLGLIHDDIYDSIMKCLAHNTRPFLSRSSPTYKRDKTVYNYLQRRIYTLRRAYFREKTDLSDI